MPSRSIILFSLPLLLIVAFKLAIVMSNGQRAAATPENGHYNEAEVVGLISEIYKVLTRLGHFEDDDVAWLPPEGHELPLCALEHSERIDTRVISLMEHVPIGKHSKCLVPWQLPANYLHPDGLVMSRDIDRTNYWGLRRNPGSTNAIRCRPHSSGSRAPRVMIR